MQEAPFGYDRNNDPVTASERVSDLESRIVELESERDAALEDLKNTTSKADQLFRELVAHREMAENKNYWAWQGDGEDHLETLSNSCPVLLHVHDLKQILEAKGAALKACAEMRSQLELVFKCCCDEAEWDSIDGDEVKRALSTECGKDYVHKSEIKPLVEALKDCRRKPEDKSDLSAIIRMGFVIQKALAHAEKLMNAAQAQTPSNQEALRESKSQYGHPIPKPDLDQPGDSCKLPE